MAKIGPVLLQVQGDSFVQPCRISAIAWEGASTAGDVCRVLCPITGIQLWKGRAVSSQTYEGMSFPNPGIHAPFGFVLDHLDSGACSVYLVEN